MSFEAKAGDVQWGIWSREVDGTECVEERESEKDARLTARHHYDGMEHAIVRRVIPDWTPVDTAPQSDVAPALWRVTAAPDGCESEIGYLYEVRDDRWMIWLPLIGHWAISRLHSGLGQMTDDGYILVHATLVEDSGDPAPAEQATGGVE